MLQYQYGMIKVIFKTPLAKAWEIIRTSTKKDTKILLEEVLEQTEHIAQSQKEIWGMPLFTPFNEINIKNALDFLFYFPYYDNDKFAPFYDKDLVCINDYVKWLYFIKKENVDEIVLLARVKTYRANKLSLEIFGEKKYRDLEKIEITNLLMRSI